MKKLKLMALVLAAGLSITIANQANAEIGYLNYQKVLDNYPAAQQAVKEIDAKSLELQTANEFKTKQEALFKLRNDKEAQILNQVQTAAKAIMVSQKLDAVVADQVIFVGGVDITDLIIQKLKGQ